MHVARATEHQVYCPPDRLSVLVSAARQAGYSAHVLAGLPDGARRVVILSAILPSHPNFRTVADAVRSLVAAAGAEYGGWDVELDNLTWMEQEAAMRQFRADESRR